MPQIVGPNGRSVEVTSDGKLRAYSVIESEALHANEDDQQAYSLIVSRTPTGAADVFLYIKNTGDGELVITSIKLWTASAEQVQIKLGDTGTPSGGSTLTPANRNAGSANTPDATIEDGVNITGLSSGSVVDDITGSTTPVKWEWDSGLMLTKNTAATFYAVTGAVAVRMTVSFYIHNS